MSAPALDMCGVRRTFPSPAGPVEVLRGADLRIAPGEFVALTGPSGSGKSTLLHLAALLDVPDEGGVAIAGEETGRMTARRRNELRARRIGMIFQRGHLLPHRSVLANVAFRFRYTEESGSTARAASERALAAVGLSDLAHRTARVLSGGEAQRVAIARAIALPPALLLADEPTGNLDRASGERVMDTLAALHRDGMSILLVTHNEELLRYCTRHVVLRDGRIHEAPR